MEKCVLLKDRYFYKPSKTRGKAFVPAMRTEQVKRYTVFFQVGICCLFSLLLCGILSAQPPNDACTNAIPLCPKEEVPANNVDAGEDTCSGCPDDPSAWSNCYEPRNTVWFRFTTNANGGSVTVGVDLGSCLSGGSKGDALQGVVLEAGTACDGSTYSSVSNCIDNGMGTFNLNASGLAPNTDYWVQISGARNGNASSPAECDFSISVSGPAVEFLVDTSIVPKDCQGSDGEIHVSNVSGGNGPYSFALDGGSYQASGDFTGLDAGTHEVSVKDANGCTQKIAPIQIPEVNSPSIDTALIDSASCSTADGKIELDGMTGGTTPYQFELDGGAGQSDSVFNNVGAGMHDVILTDASGCSDTLNDIAVPNKGGIDHAQESTKISECGLDNGEASVDSIAGGSSPYSYQWDDPSSQTDCVATGLAPGSYEVTITDANGCSFTIHNVNVGEEDPDTASLSLIVDKNPICQGETVNFTADLVNGGGSPTYEWFLNGSSVQSGGNSSYSNSNLSDGDEVQVAVYPNDPCIVPDTLTSNPKVISVRSPVNTTLNMDLSKTSICEGDNVKIMLDANGTGSSPTYSCSKNGSNFYTGAEDTLSYSGFEDGDQVSCQVLPSHPCGDTVSTTPKTIEVTPFDPNVEPKSSEIFKGESVDLQASGGDSYSWTPGASLSNNSSPNTTASPDQTTTYDIEIQKQNCDRILRATVRVKDLIKPPNTITPNGDGKNDRWRIPGIDRFPNAEVSVYDRWGQRIFHSLNYGPDNRWNATSGGQKVPAGTYYYVIQLNREEADLSSDAKDTFTGSLTVLY